MYVLKCMDSVVLPKYKFHNLVGIRCECNLILPVAQQKTEDSY